jgi:parallel beta-helix repeat protein
MVFSFALGSETARTRIRRTLTTALLAASTVLLAAAHASAQITSVATINALRLLPAPTSAVLVTVANHTIVGDGGGGPFRFNTLSTAADNNGTIVAPVSGARGRWMRVYTGPLSVRWFGARGDGATYDTVAIQGAVNAAPAGGTVAFPAGTYRIRTDRGVQLKSNLRLNLGTAVLVGPNVDGARCRIFWIEGQKNIVISGGTLVGSLVGSPEWGIGILASDAQYLTIENVRIQSFFFDGILLTGNTGCRYVSINGVASVGNRRNGLAIVSATDVTVTGSAFQGTAGQSPQAGIDVEPDAGTTVARVSIENSVVEKNKGIGLYVHKGLGTALSDVTITGNVVRNNDQGIAVVSVDRAAITDNTVTGHHRRSTSGIVVGATTGVIRIAANQLVDNFRGILAADASVEILKNNVVGTGPLVGAGSGSDGDGIVCRSLSAPDDEPCVLSMNTVSRAAGSGIQVAVLAKALVAGNVVKTTGQRGILLWSSSASTVRDNTVSAAGLEAPGTYYVIQLAQNSDNNVVTRNLIGVGTAKGSIGIEPDCGGNSVYSNSLGAVTAAARGGTAPGPRPPRAIVSALQ